MFRVEKIWAKWAYGAVFQLKQKYVVCSVQYTYSAGVLATLLRANVIGHTKIRVWVKETMLSIY